MKEHGKGTWFDNVEDTTHGPVTWTLVILYKAGPKFKNTRERLMSILDTRLTALEKSESDRKAEYETLV